ncbi:MAG: hypothetical protein MZV64_23950 [Ignavibacteriales bacterium]|nr:hypothetical protein [Ignavibacteriales bacterium]
MLAFLPAHAQAERQPSAGDNPRRSIRGEGWVPERERRHQRAELDALCVVRQPRERRPQFERDPDRADGHS